MNLSRFVAPFRLLHGDENQANWEGLEEYLGLSVIERGTSLPTNPVDGQEYDYIADANKGIIWRFRYRATSAAGYKWEFVGGPDLYTETVGSITTAASEVAPVELTNGPTITPPRTGDYEVAMQLLVSEQTATVSNMTGILVKNKEVATKIVWLIFIGTGTFSGAWMQKRDPVNLEGGKTYSIYVGNNNAVSTLYEFGRFYYRPIRVS